MLNLLAFNEGMHETYLKYGKVRSRSLLIVLTLHRPSASPSGPSAAATPRSSAASSRRRRASATRERPTESGGMRLLARTVRHDAVADDLTSRSESGALRRHGQSKLDAAS